MYEMTMAKGGDDDAGTGVVGAIDHLTDGHARGEVGSGVEACDVARTRRPFRGRACG